MKLEYLRQLIKRLTKNEKRNFNQYRNADKLQVFYGLYDAISKEAPNFKSSASQNDYLFKKILDSVQLHNYNSVIAEFYNLYLGAEICMSKGLNEIAHSYIKKSIEICNKYELFEQKATALKLKNYIEKNLLVEEFNPEIFNEELDKCIENQQIYLKYSILISKLFSIIRNDQRIARSILLKKISKIENSKMMQKNIDELPSFSAKKEYLICWQMLTYLKRDHEKRITYLSQSLVLFEKYPQFKIKEEKGYIATFHHLLITYRRLQQWNKFKINYDKLKNIKIDSLENQAFRFQAELDCALGYYSNKDFESYKKHVIKMQKEFQKYSTFLSAEYKLVYYINFAFANYRIGRIRDSLKLLETIKRNNWGNIRVDIQQISEIMWLIYQYSLGEYQLVNQTAKSVIKRHQRQYELSETEKLVFKFFCSKHLLSSSIKNRIEKLSTLKDQLDKLVDENEYEKKYNTLFYDFRIWINDELNKLK